MKNKPNYELKSKILNNRENYDLYVQCQKKLYAYCVDKCSYEEYLNSLEVLKLLQDNQEEYEEYGRISHARYSRVSRLKKRIADIIVGHNALFLTLTFTDEKLANTIPSFRRKAVQRFLKQFNVAYVGNIDFGKKNHREHYHAVIRIDKIDYSLWKYGAIHGLKIRNSVKVDEETGELSCEDITKLARYVAKLTNHAIKETTKRSVIIYSRNNSCAKREKSEKEVINRMSIYNDEPLLDLFIQGNIKL